MSSARLTVTAWTSTSTSLGPSSGVGTSRYSITSGPPKRSKITAFIALPVLGQRLFDGFFEARHAVELLGRTHVPVRTNLVHVGVDLERVAVRILELDAHVTTGSAPA